MLAKKQNGAFLFALILNLHSGMLMGAASSANESLITAHNLVRAAGLGAGFSIVLKAASERSFSLRCWEEESELWKLLNRSWLEKKIYGEPDVNQRIPGSPIYHACFPTLLHLFVHRATRPKQLKNVNLLKVNFLIEHGADLHSTRDSSDMTPFERIMFYAKSPDPDVKKCGKDLLFMCQRNGRMDRAMYDQAEATGVHMTDEAISAHLRTPRSSVARRLAKTSKSRINQAHLDLSAHVATFLTSTPLQKEEPQERE